VVFGEIKVESLLPVGADVDPEKFGAPANATPKLATIENKNCPVPTVIGVVLGLIHK
jgi:hypothetical protein